MQWQVETKAKVLLVSIRVAAQMLGLSPWTIISWARQNPPKIRTVLLGRLRKVPVEEVERLARGGENQ